MTRVTPTRFAGLAVACVLVAGVALAMLTLKGPEPTVVAPSPEAIPAAPRSEAPPPSAAEPATRSLTIAPKAPAARGTESEPMAQSFRAYCQTSQGVCVLPSAQPIGSPCTCPDGAGGRVIP